VPTYADRGCCVVSATDFYGRILGFLDHYATLAAKKEIYKNNKQKLNCVNSN
jgi:hypothetical protein